MDKSFSSSQITKNLIRIDTSFTNPKLHLKHKQTVLTSTCSWIWEMLTCQICKSSSRMICLKRRRMIFRRVIFSCRIVPNYLQPIDTPSLRCSKVWKTVIWKLIDCLFSSHSAHIYNRLSLSKKMRQLATRLNSSMATFAQSHYNYDTRAQLNTFVTRQLRVDVRHWSSTSEI